MLWRQIRPQTEFRVCAQRPISESEIRVITFLYAPIIHSRAYSLYLFLYHQIFPDLWRSEVFSHRFLMDALGMNLKELISAREQLEAVGLLSVYRLKEMECLEYHLLPPLTPYQFFQSDVLNLMLFNRVGSSTYRRLRERFSLPIEMRLLENVGKEETTKSFSEVFPHLQWSELSVNPQSETDRQLQEAKEALPLPEVHSQMDGKVPEVELDFEYLELLFSQEDRLVLFTPENKRRMARTAFLYGLNEEQLGILLKDTYYGWRKVWDIPRFEELARRYFQARSKEAQPDAQPVTQAPRNKEEHLQILKTISPYQLLRNYQNGGQLSIPDKNLIDYLLHDLGLSPEVVNVLIDFVLLTNDNQLPRAITEKIASSWKRKGFQTAEEAFAFAQQAYEKSLQGRKSGYRKKEGKRTAKAVPDYIWLEVERERQEDEEKAKGTDKKADLEQIKKLIEELEGEGGP